MVGLSRKEIEHLARLARLSLSQEEVVNLNKDLSSILTFVEEISVLPQSQPLEEAAVKLDKLRLDVESGDRLTMEKLQTIALKMEGRYVEAPVVFEDESSA